MNTIGVLIFGCFCAAIGFFVGLIGRWAERENVWPHEPELDCELPPLPPEPLSLRLSLCPDYALPTADGRLLEIWI